MFVWGPIIGDPLTVIAGILKIDFGLFLLPVGTGKFLRYVAIFGVYFIGALLILIAFVCIITLVKSDDFMMFIYFAGLALFGFQFAIGNIQTLSSDLFKGPSVGTLAGLAGTIAAVSPIIMNWFIGTITQGGSYTPAFIAITVSVVLAVLAIFILIRKIRLVDSITH